MKRRGFIASILASLAAWRTGGREAQPSPRLATPQTPAFWLLAADCDEANAHLRGRMAEECRAKGDEARAESHERWIPFLLARAQARRTHAAKLADGVRQDASA